MESLISNMLTYPLFNAVAELHVMVLQTKSAATALSSGFFRT